MVLSTAQAMVNLIDNIECAIDTKQFVCGVFIDLQKAFDTVNHNILLEKIQHYGIRGIAHYWLNLIWKTENSLYLFGI